MQELSNSASRAGHILRHAVGGKAGATLQAVCMNENRR
jgi:hypothetical protein